MTQNTAAPRRVVVGVDGSDNAARAATWAAREADDRSLPLHLVHATNLPGAMGQVYEPPHYAATRNTAGEKLLDEMAGSLRETHPNLTITTEISELAAAETMVDLSADAHLVVTGTRGLGGFAGLLLGSVSHALAAHAQCPAVVVRGEEPGGPLNEIVLGVEPGQAEAPVRFAFDTAARIGASVAIVRAWSLPSAYRDSYTFSELNTGQAAQEADVEDLIKAVRAEYPHVESSVNAIRGNAVPVLINASQGSRLLIVGARRHRGPLSVGIGYVVQGLLSHSLSPVAVVPIA
jgi:nucleotide-binding universal stress UspA family protein